MGKVEMKVVLSALKVPLIFVLVIVGIHFFQTEVLMDSFATSSYSRLPWSKYGMQPKKVVGLRGIFTMPFLHGSWNHVYNNITALLFLGWAMMYFYKQLVVKTTLAIMILGGIWLWFAGEAGSTHIGASGLVYGLVSFLFFSGLLRRYKPLIAISLLVIFLYGSLFWGIFPVKINVSWEGHLWGAVAGVVMAFYYQYAGPQRPKYQWEIEDDEAGNAPDAPWRLPEDRVSPAENMEEDQPRVVYHWKRRGRGD